MNRTRAVGLSAVGIIAGLLTTMGGTTQAAGPDDVQAAKQFRVVAQVSASEPMLGDQVKIRGEVKPARPGQTVKLQIRFGTTGKWKTKASGNLNKKSKFKFVDKMGTVRFRQYRVLKPADGNRKTGMGPQLGVTVYAWRDLTSLSPVAENHMYEGGSVKINGTAYPNSLLSSTYSSQGSIGYNLERRCKSFEGRFGLDDDSEVTATGTAELDGDVTSLYTGTFSLTQSAMVVRDVTGVFRVTVRWTSTNTAGTPEDQSGAGVAVASPRVLCSF